MKKTGKQRTTMKKEKKKENTEKTYKANKIKLKRPTKDISSGFKRLCALDKRAISIRRKCCLVNKVKQCNLV